MTPPRPAAFPKARTAGLNPKGLNLARPGSSGAPPIKSAKNSAGPRRRRLRGRCRYPPQWPMPLNKRQYDIQTTERGGKANLYPVTGGGGAARAIHPTARPGQEPQGLLMGHERRTSSHCTTLTSGTSRSAMISARKPSQPRLPFAAPLSVGQDSDAPLRKDVGGDRQIWYSHQSPRNHGYRRLANVKCKRPNARSRVVEPI